MSHVPYHPHAHSYPQHALDTVREPVGDQSGTAFNDSEALQLSTFAGLASIEVFYDSARVYGFRAKYSDNEGKDAQVEHTARTDVSAAQLTLGFDEFLVEVSGLVDGGISRLALKTNRGNSVNVGGSAGSAFAITAPTGFCFKALSGRLGDNLKAIGGELRPVPMRRSVERLFPSVPQQNSRVSFPDVFPRFPLNSGIRRVGMTFNAKGFLSLEVHYWPEGKEPASISFPHVDASDVTADVFDLSKGEFLTCVRGTIDGGIVTSLGFETSKGRKRSWGVAKGTPFSDTVKSGHRAIGLTTSYDASGLKGVKLDVGYPLPNTVVITSA